MDLQDQAFRDGREHLQTLIVFKQQKYGARGGEIAGVDVFPGHDPVKRRGEGGIPQHGLGFMIPSLGNGMEIDHRLDGLGSGGTLLQEVLFPFQIAFGLGQLGLGLTEPGRDLFGADGDQQIPGFHPGTEQHRHPGDHAGDLGGNGGPLGSLNRAHHLGQGRNLLRAHLGY